MDNKRPIVLKNPNHNNRQSLICAGDKTENNFLYFFTELKTSHLFYSIYKHDANDIAYPSSNHRMRVIYVLRNGPCSPSTLCGSAEEHRSAKSDGLKSDSSWGLRIVSLSHAREKTKDIFLYFFTELKTIYLSYSIYDTHSLHLAGSYGVLRFWSKNLIWFDLFKAILFSFFKVISCSCFGYMLQNLAAHLPCFKVLQILFDLAFPFGTQLPYELLRSHLLVILSQNLTRG